MMLGRVLLVALVLLIGEVGCRRNSGEPVERDAVNAEKIYNDALATAKQTNRAVEVLFLHPEVAWSQRIDEFHAASEVAAILSKYLVLVRIDLNETPGGLSMFYDRGGDRGQPAFSIVDYKGMLLADSGGQEENVGFPNTDEEVGRYLEIMKTAIPKITDVELAVLRSKLEEMRVPTP